MKSKDKNILIGIGVVLVIGFILYQTGVLKDLGLFNISPTGPCSEAIQGGKVILRSNAVGGDYGGDVNGNSMNYMNNGWIEINNFISPSESELVHLGAVKHFVNTPFAACGEGCNLYGQTLEGYNIWIDKQMTYKSPGSSNYNIYDIVYIIQDTSWTSGSGNPSNGWLFSAYHSEILYNSLAIASSIPDGSCSTTPINCIENELRCNSNDIQKCIGNTWVNQETCSTGCTNGACNSAGCSETVFNGQVIVRKFNNGEIYFYREGSSGINCLNNILTNLYPYVKVSSLGPTSSTTGCYAIIYGISPDNKQIKTNSALGCLQIENDVYCECAFSTGIGSTYAQMYSIPGCPATNLFLPTTHNPSCTQTIINCIQDSDCGSETCIGGVCGGTICTPSWTCTPWSQTCNGGVGTQTRTCTDSNACGVLTGKPAETQTCILGEVCTAEGDIRCNEKNRELCINGYWVLQESCIYGCTNKVCWISSTTPTCSDGIQNQLEEGIDCGGPCTACSGGGGGGGGGGGTCSYTSATCPQWSNCVSNSQYCTSSYCNSIKKSCTGGNTCTSNSNCTSTQSCVSGICTYTTTTTTTTTTLGAQTTTASTITNYLIKYGDYWKYWWIFLIILLLIIYLIIRYGRYKPKSRLMRYLWRNRDGAIIGAIGMLLLTAYYFNVWLWIFELIKPITITFWIAVITLTLNILTGIFGGAWIQDIIRRL